MKNLFLRLLVAGGLFLAGVSFDFVVSENNDSPAAQNLTVQFSVDWSEFPKQADSPTEVYYFLRGFSDGVSDMRSRLQEEIGVEFSERRITRESYQLTAKYDSSTGWSATRVESEVNVWLLDRSMKPVKLEDVTVTQDPPTPLRPWWGSVFGLSLAMIFLVVELLWRLTRTQKDGG